MSHVPGDFIHFRTKVADTTWVVEFGQVVQIGTYTYKVNVGDRIVFVDPRYIVEEGEKFQDRLI